MQLDKSNDGMYSSCDGIRSFHWASGDRRDAGVCVPRAGTVFEVGVGREKSNLTLWVGLEVRLQRRVEAIGIPVLGDRLELCPWRIVTWDIVGYESILQHSF